jgi:hypothetical protein
MGTAVSRVIGVGLLLGALYTAHRSIEFRREGELVVGRVVAIEAEVTHDHDSIGYSEKAEIRYVPRAGGPSRVLRSGWNNVLFGAHEVGDEVTVRYLPEDPDDAREDSLLRDALLPLLLGALGIAGILGRLQSSHSGADTTIWHRRRE